MGRTFTVNLLEQIKQESAENAPQHTNLILLDIDILGLKSLLVELADLPSDIHVHVFHCDLADLAQIACVLQQARAAIVGSAPISIVVNNAGMVTGKPLEELSVEAFEKTLRVNTTAQFAVLKEVVPDMIKLGNGLVVTVASLMGLLGSARLSDYCASKWALLGMHESLRHEVRAQGAGKVRFLAVCPYVIDTGMFAGAFEGEGWVMAVVRTLFPPLRVEFVAARMLQAMRNHEDFVVVPSYMGIVPPLLRLLPVPLQDVILELSGCTKGMQTFRGRQKVE